MQQYAAEPRLSAPLGSSLLLTTLQVATGVPNLGALTGVGPSFVN